MEISKTVYDEDEDEEFVMTFPAKHEVCDTCQGHGSTYLGLRCEDQPGFTREDFDNEDPDFEDRYMSGGYDKACPECKGLRVVKVIDRNVLNDEQKEALEILDRKADEDADYRRLCEMERRMGC